MCTAEAVGKFDTLVADIAKQNNPREHKRLKFVNCNLLEWSLVEQKLLLILAEHLNPAEMVHLAERLECAVGECRVCECLLALIAHVEGYISKHEELLKAVIGMMHEVGSLKEDTDLLKEVVIKCSLMIYDAFHGLCAFKRIITSITTSYQVPYYYDLTLPGGNTTEGPGSRKGSVDGVLRFRSSLLSTYKNLNTIIDDLSTVSEALWIIRNYDLLGV